MTPTCQNTYQYGNNKALKPLNKEVLQYRWGHGVTESCDMEAVKEKR